MTIKQSVLEGKIPNGLEIFDAHSHINEGAIIDNYLHHLDLKRSIALAAKMGVKRMAASSLRALWGDPAGGNKRLFEICDDHPGVIYGYYYYCPHNAEECMAKMERYIAHPAFIGIKIHPGCDKISVDSGRYDPVFEYALARNIVVLTHAHEADPVSDPSLFKRVLNKYPGLRIILGHTGGLYNGAYTACELAREYPNVYLELNGMYYSHIWIEKLVERAPFERFLFGTDQTFNDPAITLGRVLLSDLSDGEKRDILYGNFARMMNDPRFPVIE